MDSVTLHFFSDELEKLAADAFTKRLLSGRLPGLRAAAEAPMTGSGFGPMTIVDKARQALSMARGGRQAAQDIAIGTAQTPMATHNLISRGQTVGAASRLPKNIPLELRAAANKERLATHVSRHGERGSLGVDGAKIMVRPPSSQQFRSPSSYGSPSYSPPKRRKVELMVRRDGGIDEVVR